MPRRAFKDDPANWQRLLQYHAVKRFGCDQEQAQDAALYGICAGIERGCEEYTYMYAAMKFFILKELRWKAKRHVQMDVVAPDVIEEARLRHSTITSPEEVAHANRVVEFLEELPPQYREALTLAANEHSIEEIAARLGLTVRQTNSRLENARKALRKKLGQEVKRPSSSKYAGVRKVRRKWRAYAHVNGKPVSGGYHETEREAAIARDILVKTLGLSIPLNFAETTP